MHYRMSGNIPVLSLQDTSSTPSPAMSPDIAKYLGEGVCSSAWLRAIELSGSSITHTYFLAVDAICSNRLGILKLLIHTHPTLILHLPTVRSRKFQDTAVSSALVFAKGSAKDIIGG